MKRYISSSWILILAVILGWTSAVWAELPSDFEQVWPPVPQTALERVAVSPDGLVLAGGNGPGVLLSRDQGVSWQRFDLPVGGDLRGLSWGDGGFLAVTSIGDVLRSETGEQWELEAQDPPLDWVENLLWTGEAFVAVGGDCVASDCAGFPSWTRISKSPNGHSWTTVDDRNLYYGKWYREIVEGDGVLVVGPLVDSDHYSPGGVLTSRDSGESWEESEVGFTVAHLAHLGDQIFALGQRWVGGEENPYETVAASSVDGVVWESLDASSLDVERVDDVCSFGDSLIAVTDRGTFESPDGANWTLVADTSSVAMRFGALTEVAGQGLLGVGRGESVLKRETNSWRVLTSAGFPDLRRIASSGGRWVAGGTTWLPGMSPILVSGDGEYWVPLDLPVELRNISDVVFGDGFFLAAAGETVLKSLDGLLWEAFQLSGSKIEALVPVEGGIIGVGADSGNTGGTVVWTDNGVSWQEIATASAPLFEIACVDSGACVAIGRPQVVLRGSLEGPWTQGSVDPDDDELVVYSVASHENRWVIGSSTGLSSSRDAHDWAQGWERPWWSPETSELDVAWVGDGFLTAGEYEVEVQRSVDGLAWGRAVSSASPADHIDGTSGDFWLLGSGGLLARKEASVGPGSEAAFSYLLPAAAHLEGLGGTRWRSELVLSPVGVSEIFQADFFYLRSGEAAAHDSRRRMAGEMRETFLMTDVVAETFSEEGSAGAILIHSESPLAGWSRTWTEDGESGGTYGQMIPLLPVEELGPVQNLIGVRSSDDFHTNLGLVNAEDHVVAAQIEVLDSLGQILLIREQEIGAWSYLMLSRFLVSEVANPAEAAWIRVRFPVNQSGSPHCLAFASVVDDLSGDPTLLMPQAGSAGDQMIPVAVHLPGYNQTVWRSDLDIVNTGNEMARFLVEYWPADAARPRVSSPELALAPGAAVRYQDVVVSLLNAQDKGTLIVRPSVGGIAVSSRTFTVSDAGSFGQGISAVPMGGAPLGWAGWVGLPIENDRTSGFRVNVGVVNSNPSVVNVPWRGFDNPNLELWRVPGRSLHQLDHVTEDELLASQGRAEISFNAGSGGKVFGYVSIVDNRTGDPIFYPANSVDP